jgi:uncharacterized protein involved in oxidation of intracellular sulfur
MKCLVILNESPYGNERTYNGLKLGATLAAKAEAAEVRVFLVGDAVGAAVVGQSMLEGYFNLDELMSEVTQNGGTVGVCGTSMEARGIGTGRLFESVRESSLAQLTEWCEWTDKVLVF